MARHQDEFERFVRRFGDRLVRTAYLLCGDEGAAEDIVQTALMRTARHWSRARDQPAAYARRAVVNLAKNRWRDRAARPETWLPAELLTSHAEASFDEAVLRRHALLDATLRLPGGERAVIALRFFEDLSVEETARLLGCSTGTVKSQTSRALAHLRLTLDPSKENVDVLDQ